MEEQEKKLREAIDRWIKPEEATRANVATDIKRLTKHRFYCGRR